MLHNGQKIKSGHSYQFDLRFDKEILCWFMQRIAIKSIPDRVDEINMHEVI